MDKERKGEKRVDKTYPISYSIYMRPSKRISYFNELNVDLNDEAFFSSEIYERTKDNPNPVLSSLCPTNNDSLDEYTFMLTGKVIAALRA